MPKAHSKYNFALPHARFQLDRPAIGHKRVLVAVVNGLSILLRRIDPGLKNFKNK